MKTTLTTTQAAHELLNDPNAEWTFEGAHALCEYLEQLETDTDTEIDFCPVAIRCDFTEYEDLIQWADQYFGSHEKTREEFGIDPDDEEEDELPEKIRDFIEYRGTLIEYQSGIIVGNF